MHYLTTLMHQLSITKNTIKWHREITSKLIQGKGISQMEICRGISATLDGFIYFTRRLIAYLCNAWGESYYKLTSAFVMLHLVEITDFLRTGNYNLAQIWLQSFIKYHISIRAIVDLMQSIWRKSVSIGKGHLNLGHWKYPLNSNLNGPSERHVCKYHCTCSYHYPACTLDISL